MKKRQGRKTQQGRARAKGRGMGRGKNSGMIRGMGQGRGRDRRMGFKGGVCIQSITLTPIQTKETSPQQQALANPKEEAEMLKNQLDRKEVQAPEGKNRISEIEKGGKSVHAVAVVDAQMCTECGACEDVCPDDAISIDETAVIDPAKCTGCGQCVEECPTEAISLQKV